MTDLIGWIATAIFSCSYFFRGPKALRWIQAAAALVWVTYGVLLHAKPVVAANVIVALAAVASSLRPQSLQAREPSVTQQRTY